ncbi:MAG: molybdopterin oxidoreductase [Desulfobacterales bacterium RIFOXYA12_FULL_46_15]|nr:MAG: molybdopterin oxidoreductase [Desulfobacterales bacterium RIFOXYA12_FULL_46_15]
MKKNLVCIVCPNGCDAEVMMEDGQEIKILSIDGCTCDKGKEWVVQELTSPMRTIASGIPVEHGDFKLVSVRTDAPIPLGKIFEVMTVIRHKKLKAPVAIGDILVPNPAGTACNIIATRNVAFMAV